MGRPGRPLDTPEHRMEKETEVLRTIRRLRLDIDGLPTHAQVAGLINKAELIKRAGSRDGEHWSERWGGEHPSPSWVRKYWPRGLEGMKDLAVTRLIDAGMVGSEEDVEHNSNVLADMGYGTRRIAKVLGLERTKVRRRLGKR